MNNFVIAIPSRGRIQSETFELLKTMKEPVLVYIYVDLLEREVYEDAYPEYIIVPHNSKTINAIRLFIQEHQNELGNTMLLIDDDVINFADMEGYVISFNRVINDIQKLIDSGVDCVYFPHYSEILQRPHDVNIDKEIGFTTNNNDVSWTTQNFCAFTAITISCTLYDKNIRYNLDIIAEDCNLFIQILLDESVRKMTLPFFIRKNYYKNRSHFSSYFINNACIELYLKYGDIATLNLCVDEITVYINVAGDRWLDYERTREPVYLEPHNINILQNIVINKTAGYKQIEAWKRWDEFKDLNVNMG